MTPNRRRVLRLGLGAAIVPALTLSTRAEGRFHEVAIRGFLFEPARLAVKIGDRIRFSNHDLAPHTATAQDGSWDTGTLDQGQSTELSVTADWTGGYFCAYHPSMTAQLEITA